MRKDDIKRVKLPDAPGVYTFRGPGRKILYIGKAASLSDRVRSYFSADLAASRSPAISSMVERAETVTWTETESALEALILEANLIKKHHPPYNVDEKDNKSFNYLVITKEEFPRVLIVRGRELYLTWKKKDILDLFGPFTQGGALKEALKIVRKIFPYRDTCKPGSKRPCFNRQIGLCPGVCSGEISKAEYAKTVRNIRDLFSGKKRSLMRRLEGEMKRAAKSEDFERAGRLSRQVDALRHVRDVSLIRRDEWISSGGSFRIEAFDIAHLAGQETVGVMTLVSGGEPLKSGYRKFKVRSVSNNDVAALKEVLERRLSHPEWQYPRVIVVDGGAAQLRAARRTLERAGVTIPVVAVVKDERHRPSRIIGDEDAIRINERDILLANAEAHRFAIGFHRQRRTRALLL